MSVLERVLRDAARAGARHAYLRADRAELPALPPLALEVTVVPPAGEVPAAATPLAGNVVAGVTVTDDASARAAMRALLRSCRRPYDGVADRLVIRHVSLQLTRLLTHTPLAPNHVTLANVAVGLAACWFASRGTTAGFALAGLFFFLQLVFDSSDGELARIRHRHSRAGMILDNVADDVIDSLFVAALGVGLGGPWLWVGAAAAGLRALTAIVIYAELHARGLAWDVMAFHWWFIPPVTAASAVTATAPPITAGEVLRGLGRRDLYGLVFSVTCLAGVPQVAFAHGVILGAGYGVLAVVHVVKRPPLRGHAAQS